MKIHLLLVLYSALEGVTDADIPTRMLDVLDMHAIQSQIRSSFLFMEFSTQKKSNEDDDVLHHLKQELLLYVFFLEKLSTCLQVTSSQRRGGDPLDFIQCQDDPVLSAKLKKFIDHNLGAVEVMWNGKIERAFFQLSPVCQKLAGSRVWKQGALEALRSISPDSRSNPVLKVVQSRLVVLGTRTKQKCTSSV